MNTAFCMLLSLAIYLELRFATFGTDSKFLFAEDYSRDLPAKEEADDPAPLASLASVLLEAGNTKGIQMCKVYCIGCSQCWQG